MRAMIVVRDWSKSVECSRQPISLLFSVRWPHPTQTVHIEEHILPRQVAYITALTYGAPD